MSRLSAGSEEGPCEWLKDKHGRSWQIIPRALGEWMQDKDRKRARGVMQAMLRMREIGVGELQRAYAGG